MKIPSHATVPLMGGEVPIGCQTVLVQSTWSWISEHNAQRQSLKGTASKNPKILTNLIFRYQVF